MASYENKEYLKETQKEWDCEWENLTEEFDNLYCWSKIDFITFTDLK